MTIVTKYEIGTKIHFMHTNKALNTIVRGFKIEVTEKNLDPDVTYFCGKEPEQIAHIKVAEKDAYPSKEALLKSL